MVAWTEDERSKANLDSAGYHLSLAADLLSRENLNNLVEQVEGIRRVLDKDHK